MNDTEVASEMYTRFIKIVNRLKALDRKIPNVELVNNILTFLPKN